MAFGVSAEQLTGLHSYIKCPQGRLVDEHLSDSNKGWLVYQMM